jgi:hypothetical protein
MTKHKFTQKFTIGELAANGTIGFVLRNQESLPESSSIKSQRSLWLVENRVAGHTPSSSLSRELEAISERWSFGRPLSSGQVFDRKNVFCRLSKKTAERTSSLKSRPRENLFTVRFEGSRGFQSYPELTKVCLQILSAGQLNFNID